jgi:exodeoxyribonuclease-5
MLTEVHRQARDNPIIRMSMAIREGRRLQRGRYGESLVVRSRDDAVTSCARSCSRRPGHLRHEPHPHRLQSSDPAAQGAAGASEPTGTPSVGDRLICLRNNREKTLFNGGMFMAEHVDDKFGQLDMIATRSTSSATPVSSTSLAEFFCGTRGRPSTGVSAAIVTSSRSAGRSPATNRRAHNGMT